MILAIVMGAAIKETIGVITIKATSKAKNVKVILQVNEFSIFFEFLVFCFNKIIIEEDLDQNHDLDHNLSFSQF